LKLARAMTTARATTTIACQKDSDFDIGNIST
jgi:hypothetical protein